MTTSDVLKLLSILLAIIAFISEKNRNYIFLKFSTRHRFILIAAFIYLHFLLSYKWWRGKFDFLGDFEFYGWPSASAWAYLLSISILFWLVWRIFWSKFPIANSKKLLAYYDGLLQKNESIFLSELIEKFHLDQVIEFLKKKKTIVVKNLTGFYAMDESKHNEAFDNAINTTSLIYGNLIFHQIMMNDKFIDDVVNFKPYLFTEIIKEMDHQKTMNSDFVNHYLKILTKQKNQSFFREIRNNQNLTNAKAYRIEKERPILYSLFNNAVISSQNQAWRGISDQAILEVEEEAKKDFSPLRESNLDRDNDLIWDYRIMVAIFYMDIMVREAVVQDVEDHMWMFYYRIFVRSIISNMVKMPFSDSDINRNSRNFDLVERICTNMMDWKSVSIKTRKMHLISSIYECIGHCIYEIAITEKLRLDDKRYLINWIWEDLILTFIDNDENNEMLNEIINNGFKTFKRPTTLLTTNKNNYTPENTYYLEVLKYVWDKRDSPKFDGGLEERVNKFKNEVIEPLFG